VSDKGEGSVLALDKHWFPWFPHHQPYSKRCTWSNPTTSVYNRRSHPFPSCYQRRRRKRRRRGGWSIWFRRRFRSLQSTSISRGFHWWLWSSAFNRSKPDI